jgi:hypothetical protein
MTKPTLPTWATDTNYTSGPANGTPTKVALSAPAIAQGYLPGQEPGAQNFNDILSKITAFQAWQDRDVSIHRFPEIASTDSSWSQTNVAFPGDPIITSSGAGYAYVDLRIPVGGRLRTVTIALFGDASADLIALIEQHFADATAANPLQTVTATNQAASWADYTLNMEASAGPIQINVTAATGTYTRLAGSFVTDGFYAGQVVTFSGFSHSGNNVTWTLTNVTATTLVINNGNPGAGMVDETGSGTQSAAGVCPVVNTSQALQLRLHASAANLRVKALRYTYSNPT